MQATSVDAVIDFPAAHTALDQAVEHGDFETVLNIQAEALAAFRTVRNRRDHLLDAAELYLDAIRAAGRIAGTLERSRGGRPSNTRQPHLTSIQKLLQAADISRQALPDWIRVAAVPNAGYDLYKTQEREARRPVSMAGLLRFQAKSLIEIEARGPALFPDLYPTREDIAQVPVGPASPTAPPAARTRKTRTPFERLQAIYRTEARAEAIRGQVTESGRSVLCVDVRPRFERTQASLRTAAANEVYDSYNPTREALIVWINDEQEVMERVPLNTTTMKPNNKESRNDD